MMIVLVVKKATNLHEGGVLVLPSSPPFIVLDDSGVVAETGSAGDAVFVGWFFFVLSSMIFGLMPCENNVLFVFYLFFSRCQYGKYCSEAEIMSRIS
jgi:hypothetical protein